MDCCSKARHSQLSTGEIENTNTGRVSLVIGVAISIAVLSLGVAVGSLRQSVVLNSNFKSNFAPLKVEMKMIQLSLKQSINAVDKLLNHITAIQTDTATQNGEYIKLTQTHCHTML